MTQEQWMEFFKAFQEEQRDITSRKNPDYSLADDAMASFKEQAVDVGLDPMQVWFVQLGKHLQAIKTHVRGNELKSESFRHRCLDVANYMALGCALNDESDTQRSNYEGRDYEVNVVTGEVSEKHTDPSVFTKHIESKYPGIQGIGALVQGGEEIRQAVAEYQAVEFKAHTTGVIAHMLMLNGTAITLEHLLKAGTLTCLGMSIEWLCTWDEFRNGVRNGKRPKLASITMINTVRWLQANYPTSGLIKRINMLLGNDDFFESNKLPLVAKVLKNGHTLKTARLDAKLDIDSLD